jgi:hypothetical protein
VRVRPVFSLSSSGADSPHYPPGRRLRSTVRGRSCVIQESGAKADHRDRPRSHGLVDSHHIHAKLTHPWIKKCIHTEMGGQNNIILNPTAILQVREPRRATRTRFIEAFGWPKLFLVLGLFALSLVWLHPSSHLSIACWSCQSYTAFPDLYEASISELQAGLDSGHFTSVHLVKVRINFLDSMLRGDRCMEHT